MNPLLTPSLRRASRWGIPLALALVLAVSGCYTQLSATNPSPSGQTTAPVPAERGDAMEGQAAARVGLNGMAVESYVAEHGDYEGAYDEYYYEDGYATDDVAVTRYQADADYYDAYYGGSYSPTYVSHHYYYPRWQRRYYAPVHFTPAWGHFYDPYSYRPGWSFSMSFGYGVPGWGSHIGFSYGYSPYHGFYDPWYSAAWYDPFFYDPFYASAWHRPHYSRYSYSSGYRHGFSRGFLAGSFYSPYHYYSPQPGRYVEPPRGSVRSALDPYATRSRRSALASVTAAERGVRLDAPVGTRSARLLADDARQHVLTQRGTRLGDAPRAAAPADRGVTDRAPRVGTQPSAGEAARGTRLGTPRTETATRPEAGARTGAPAERGGRTATPPVRTERSGQGTTPESAPARPERSRWAQPPAPREETARPAPQRPTTRTAPPPRTEERGTPPPPRQTETGRQAPPPRETVTPPSRSTPSVRQAPPPREETRPAPPAREETRPTPPPAREETRSTPPPREETRPAARPPARRAAPPPPREETRQAPPQESRSTPAPAPRAQPRQAPPPRQAAPAPSRDTARSSAPSRPAREAAPQRRSGGDSGSRSSRSGRGGDDE
jgi:hypothetical protein